MKFQKIENFDFSKFGIFKKFGWLEISLAHFWTEKSKREAVRKTIYQKTIFQFGKEEKFGFQVVHATYKKPCLTNPNNELPRSRSKEGIHTQPP